MDKSRHINIKIETTRWRATENHEKRSLYNLSILVMLSTAAAAGWSWHSAADVRRATFSLSSSTYSQFSMPYATHIKRHIILFWFDCCLCNAVPMWCDVMCVMADADDVMTVKVARASVYDTYVGWWHNMYCWSLMLRAAAAAATVAAAAPKHRIVLVLLS